MHPFDRIAFVRSVVAAAALAVLSACGPGNDVQRPGPSGGSPSTMPSNPTPPLTEGAVAVKNSTDVAIWYIYLSSASSSQWGPDQLGDNVVLSGATFTLTGVPAGRYDLKAVTSTGAAAYVWNFSVAGGSTHRITVY